jgi:Ca-activated chloride channel family protein
VPDGLGGTRRLPAAIVLLSDGANTRGEDPIDVAQRAKKAGIKIYAVALGTPGGILETPRPDGSIKRENVPPDTLTLHEIARETGGRYFNAPDAAKLDSIYKGLATRFATRIEKQEVTAAFAGGALVLLLGGLALSLLRGGRLP